MRVSVTLLLLLLHSVCVHSECVQHDQDLICGVGDDVVLKPGEKGPITSVEWKHGNDLAMGWDGHELESYRQFGERGKLDKLTGEMTIRKLTESDAGVYKRRVNQEEKNPIKLRVFRLVPKPTVVHTDFKDRHEFNCSGDATDVQNVTYNWKIRGELQDHHGPMFHMLKAESFHLILYHTVSCEMENPVSSESSANFLLYVPKVIGLIVFFTLILVVIAIIIIHRCLSGSWFFQQSSMPWTAEFWRKQPGNGKGSRVQDGADGKEEDHPMTSRE